MTEKLSLKERFNRRFHTMRERLIWMIVLSTLSAVLVYIVIHSAIMMYVDAYYVSEANRQMRERKYIRDLQSYTTYRGLSSEDLDELAPWLTRNSYVYLMIYENDRLIYSSEIHTADDESGALFHFIDPSTAGIKILYPTRDEVNRNSEGSTLYALELADTTLFCSITDFTEYGYYNFANIGSLLLSILCMASMLIVFMSRSMRRVTRLAEDVATVAAGNMQHTVRTDEGQDEISDLSRNVENMRSSIVRTLHSEREAIDANTELITSMSHDIRTPLTVLLGYLDLMKYQTGDETMQGYVHAAETTALRLKSLSDDMFLYFHAFSDREVQSALAEYDAATLLDQMLSEHVLLLKENGYLIDYDSTVLKEGETTVLTDPPRLMRIVDNLFSNMTKYADKETPIVIGETVGETVALTFKNRIGDGPARGISTGLGLRTCARIASALRAGFETREEDGYFLVTLTLPKSL